MINIYMLSIFGALFLGMFSIGFQFNSVNRIFITTPKEVFENSLYIDEDYEHLLYFDNELLIENLNTYYENNLSHYVSNFSFELDYYNQDNEFCFTDHCTKVKINFKATLAFSLTYTKSINYEIVRMNNG